MSKITRISTYKPKLANKIKQDLLKKPCETYTIELQTLVKSMLYQANVPKLLGKDVTSVVDLPARLSQVCAKQASAIVRSIQEKVKLAESAHNRQKYQTEILNKYQAQTLTVDIKSVNIELDSRFIDIQPNRVSQICDYWIKITSFPRGSFLVPLKLTSHMRKMLASGYAMKTNSLRVNSDGSLGVYFHKDVTLRPNGSTLGVDMGRNKIITTSVGQMESTHSTGILVKDILVRIKRRKSTSESSKKSRTHLKNQINYSLQHNIDWANLKQLIIEDLSDIKSGNAWGKTHQHWRVGYAQERLGQLCEENGVRLTRVNAAYTSQMCSGCGFKDRGNRKSEAFRCLSCDLVMDADINAAVNIHNRGAYSPSARQKQIQTYKSR